MVNAFFALRASHVEIKSPQATAKSTRCRSSSAARKRAIGQQALAFVIGPLAVLEFAHGSRPGRNHQAA